MRRSDSPVPWSNTDGPASAAALGLLAMGDATPGRGSAPRRYRAWSGSTLRAMPPVANARKTQPAERRRTSRFTGHSPLQGGGPLMRRRDVLRARGSEDPQGENPLLRVLRVHRQEDVSSPNLPLVEFCLDLGDSHAHERTGDPADRGRPCGAPERVAMMGPAAINGPTPGMANAPMPARRPSAPPTKPPAPTPATAPSGALVLCSWAKSIVPCLLGKRMDISKGAKPTRWSSRTTRSACSMVSTIPTTAFS